jgi:hypothetical protein
MRRLIAGGFAEASMGKIVVSSAFPDPLGILIDCLLSDILRGASRGVPF